LCRNPPVYGASCALALQVSDVAQDDRELCFEILFAGVASLGNSSEVGVTEKRAFKLVIAVNQRTVELGGFVGRVDGDWRILFASSM
jgi:hypothetical protein